MTPMKYLCLVVLYLLVGSNFEVVHATDEQRKEYDKMVEEASREADAYFEEKQKEQMEAAQQEQDQADSAIDERVAAERERLDAEMDTVRNRGLGPDFTEGMRENRLQELREKRSQLDSDPEAYFGD